MNKKAGIVITVLITLSILACNGAEEATKQPEASPTSILVPTPTSIAPTSIQEFRGVRIGMPADDVLKAWGKGSAVREVGTDSKGLVVEWHYPYATLVIKMKTIGGVTCYRVAEIRPR